MTPQQRRREQKIGEILDAAEQITLESGLDGLTIHGLAKTLDYTPGALYRYFPSKQAILAELNSRAILGYHRLFDAVREETREVPLQPPEASLLLLLSTSEAFIDASSRAPGAFAMISATAADPRDLLTDDEAVHIPHLVALLGALTATIDEAVLSAAIQPGHPTHRAIALTFGMIGILQLRKLTRFSPLLNPDPIARGLARDLLVGWGADAFLVDSLAEPSRAVVERVAAASKG